MRQHLMTVVNTDSSYDIAMFVDSVPCGESARPRGLEGGADASGVYVGDQCMAWLRLRQVWARALRCGCDAGRSA